jgi:arsenite methyltransferase
MEERMTDITADDIRTQVRDHYSSISKGAATCAPGCCKAASDASGQLGYTEEERAVVPDGADLGLGCGNPTAIASLRAGETVLDLGAGGGFDCFLAARAVGPTGNVVGVDMTPEMVTRARQNASRIAAGNVDFRLGEIEHLPVADASIDVILSNCVINLSPDKPAVFREAYRVLRDGGRLAISDVVAIAPIPQELQTQAAALAGCISGAARVDDLRAMLTAAGFASVEVTLAPRSAEIVDSWLPGASRFIATATIEARRIAVTTAAEAAAPRATADATRVAPAAACCEPGCCE